MQVNGRADLFLHSFPPVAVCAGSCVLCRAVLGNRSKDNLFMKTMESITVVPVTGSNENVSRLADAVPPLASRYHVEKVWLFGSRARGTEHECSDFDVCILPAEQFSFSDCYYFEKELSEILGSEVHVMTRGALESGHDLFYSNVVRDEVLVYDSASRT